MKSVVAELEGALLKDDDLFPYLMLVAFEASGLIRFTLLLLLWPAIFLLRSAGNPDFALRLALFVSLAGVPASEIESVARAVLPKFFLDQLDSSAWRDFAAAEKRVVVTSLPRLIVDWFAREHLGATDVIGSEIAVSRFGVALGLLRKQDVSVTQRVARLFAVGESPSLGLARSRTSPFLPLCKEQRTGRGPGPFEAEQGEQTPKPKPVIFHDGRLVPFPTPAAALRIVLWIPIGIVAAFFRMLVGVFVPLRLHPYLARPFGGDLIIRGRPPSGQGGVLFVCTHRSLLDPVVLATALGRTVPAVTYSVSRFSEILSPIPTVRLTRDRKLDAARISAELSKGDLVVCPEGTTCREPFLLRFSALFAELTDQIVPVAMNCKVGMFHATTARGWKALDPVFFFMNPSPVYEVTFLEQLPMEETCAGGKSAHEVANNVQRLLADALGYECTEFTRKDKYKHLAGNDGTIKKSSSALWGLLW